MNILLKLKIFLFSKMFLINDLVVCNDTGDIYYITECKKGIYKLKYIYSYSTCVLKFPDKHWFTKEHTYMEMFKWYTRVQHKPLIYWLFYITGHMFNNPNKYRPDINETFVARVTEDDPMVLAIKEVLDRENIYLGDNTHLCYVYTCANNGDIISTISAYTIQ